MKWKNLLYTLPLAIGIGCASNIAYVNNEICLSLTNGVKEDFQKIKMGDEFNLLNTPIPRKYVMRMMCEQIYDFNCSGYNKIKNICDSMTEF